MCTIIRLACAAVIALLGCSQAFCDVIYDVALNTAALVGQGTFTLDFQFLDSTGLPVDLNNNTVSLSNFGFGSGMATGSPSLTGGASGNTSSGVSLHDVQFFNEFMQDFTAGNLLSFSVGLTTNLDPSGVPDEFTFAILDSVGNELPTSGPASEFLSVDIDSSQPQPVTYATVPGSTYAVPAPTISAGTINTPEPSTLLFLGAA